VTRSRRSDKDTFACVAKAPRARITADGEVTFAFKQKNNDFRPGERLTVFRLMQEMYLDQLALAGGEGVNILRRVKRGALQGSSRLTPNTE
jgi:hypothetical protein